MVIDGKLVKKDKNTVYVEQHYTGTVYKTDVSNVAVCTIKSNGQKFIRILDHWKANFVSWR